ncbi:MAG: PAS domain-containing protein, partial [Planctomycetota bacterium]
MSALRGSNGSDRGGGAGKGRPPASKTTKLRAALRASEQKYRQLVQSANSIIMRRDVEGRITFFNEFAQQFFGYDEGEVLGRHVVGTILPERDSAGRDMVEMIRDINRHPERYASNQNENVLRNGERVWVAWTNRPIFDQDGRLVEILAVGNDISDRKRAEDALRESDDRLRSLLRNLNVGVYRTTGGSEGRFLEANPAMARILGYESVAELMTVRVCDLYPRPEDRRASVAETAGRAGGRSHDKELQLRRKDGEFIWASVTSQVTLAEDGGVRWVDGVMEDITERRRIADELRRAKDRAQRYLDVAAVIIVALDGEGRITLANRRACEILG